MPDHDTLTISPDALEQMIQLRDQEPGDEEFALSLQVTGSHHSQFTYDLSWIVLSDIPPEWSQERHGALLVAFPKHDTPKLEGASLALAEHGLLMDNPNTPEVPQIQEPPGDLEGPLIDRIQQVLAEQVNPAIASHGGGAQLVSVDGPVAYLNLSGGCQGCGMAQATLRQGIERILVDSIEELTTVMDVTDHASGTNPYYEAHAH